MAWNGSSGKSKIAKSVKPTPKVFNSRRILWGTILVVVLAVISYWLVDHSPDERAENLEAEKKVQPKVVRKAVKPEKVTRTVKKQEKKPERKIEPKVEYVKKPGQMQLPDGKVLTFPPPKEGETSKVYAYGHLYECDHLGNFRDISKRKLFNTAFEGNLLAMANGGAYISAFLTGLDQAEVVQILKKEYKPKGDETEDELKRIAAYDEMRKAALSYIDEGGTFDAFVQEVEKFDKKERMTQLVSYSAIMNLVKEGKIQEARDTADAANALLEGKGFRPMKLPPHIEKLLQK